MGPGPAPKAMNTPTGTKRLIDIITSPSFAATTTPPNDCTPQPRPVQPRTPHTNAQPPTTAALSALMAAVGLLSSEQDLGLLFWLGMITILSGVVLVQIEHREKPEGS